jgi:tRNA (mo5U34)-methyltransferase
VNAQVVYKRVNIAGLELGLRIVPERLRASFPARLARAGRRRLFGRTVPSAAPAAAPERGARLDLSSFADPAARAIAERVNEVAWYHVLEMPYGVATPGYVDHRETKDRYGLPHDMRGLRALDVATFDGFWAFEMERRGASVTAVDIPSWSRADIPLRTLERLTPEEDERTGAAFSLAHELLTSSVERFESSVYELDAAALGTFDVVFVSDLMLHLRDPQRALERIFPLVKPDGCLLIAEPFNPELERWGNTAVTQYFGFYQYIWSIPSTLTLRTMLEVAGFRRIEEVTRLPLVYHHPFPVRKVVMRARP